MKNFYNGYVKIKVKPNGGRARWWFLHLRSEDDNFICGERVNKEGDLINNKSDEVEIDVVSKRAIVDRVEVDFNPNYGVLERV